MKGCLKLHISPILVRVMASRYPYAKDSMPTFPGSGYDIVGYDAVRNSNRLGIDWKRICLDLGGGE